MKHSLVLIWKWKNCIWKTLIIQYSVDRLFGLLTLSRFFIVSQISILLSRLKHGIGVCRGLNFLKVSLYVDQSNIKKVMMKYMGGVGMKTITYCTTLSNHFSLAPFSFFSLKYIHLIDNFETLTVC